MRRDDADDRDGLEDADDDDGVWVDDDEGQNNNDNNQQSSDVNETAQEPDDDASEQNDAGVAGVSVAPPPGTIGSPHGYELSPEDASRYYSGRR